MILPGVSGSFLLLVLGTYEPVIAAVAAATPSRSGSCSSGRSPACSRSRRCSNWLLRRAHDVVLALLIGLMVGSARVLWPWPSATGVGDPTLGAPDPARDRRERSPQWSSPSSRSSWSTS
jgi:putative membrane protein